MGIRDWFGSTQGTIPKDVPSPSEPHTLELFLSRGCPYCIRVLNAMNSLDIAVQLRDSPADRRTLLDVTGRTTVPCLFIDGTPLFESLDIIAYLQQYAQENSH